MSKLAFHACAAALAVTASSVDVPCNLAHAQAPGGEGSFRARLVNAVSLEPVAGAIVFVEEVKAELRSAADGTFALKALPDGAYHLVVTAQGFTPGRFEILLGGPAGDVKTLTLDPELHYTEVVSVSPQTRDQFEAYQATSVLAGQDLATELQGNLAATVLGQPGIAERSFGPGAARPVIRGFDGDRVVVLEDGQRMGDLSSQSADHGVNTNPAAASRVEVVRGPATLLYGSNAIGGLVNVITDLVPTSPVPKTTGSALFDVGSAAREGGAAGDLSVSSGAWAFHAGGAARRSGDVRTPDFTVDNSQSESALGHLGAAWTSDKGYLGGSYQYDWFRYGIPVVEEGQVELDPRRHSFGVRGQSKGLDGLLTSLRGTFSHKRYHHDEVVAGEIGTRFANDTTEFELLTTHKNIGRLSGTFGGWGLVRAFTSTGEEALSPPVDQGNLAAFSYQELAWPHVTIQFGARYDHARYTPEGGLRPRTFDDVSGSVGLLYRPSDSTTLAVSVARAVRVPALEELYFFGPHPGNYAFEIGNADLEAERNLGVDIAFRWRQSRASGEITFFRNSVKDYVLRQPISEEEFEDRFGHTEHEGHGHDEFPYVEFVGADAVLQGFEGHADFRLANPLVLEVGFDMVRGEATDTGEPLPRIPPMRFMAGLRFQRGPFEAGANVAFVSKQDRVFEEEEPTDGYGLAKVFASRTFVAGGTAHTVTVRLDNLTNELYYNHLSYIKAFVPEMGRNLRVIYSVGF
jgi:iron complex outermembrane receptor protein